MSDAKLGCRLFSRFTAQMSLCIYLWGQITITRECYIRLSIVIGECADTSTRSPAGLPEFRKSFSRQRTELNVYVRTTWSHETISKPCGLDGRTEKPNE